MGATLIKVESPTGQVLADHISGPNIEVARGNAAFIVRACNAHDELVAALRDLIYALPSSDGKDWAPQFNAARAALAKVTA